MKRLESKLGANLSRYSPTENRCRFLANHKHPKLDAPRQKYSNMCRDVFARPLASSHIHQVTIADNERQTWSEPSISSQGLRVVHWWVWSPEWRASEASCVWRPRSCTRWDAACRSHPPGTCCRRRRRWGWGGPREASAYWCSTRSATDRARAALLTSAGGRRGATCTRGAPGGWRSDNGAPRYVKEYTGNKSAANKTMSLSCKRGADVCRWLL